MVHRDGAELGGSGPCGLAAPPFDWTTGRRDGLQRTAIADNVISNDVSPVGGPARRGRMGTMSRSSVGAARIREPVEGPVNRADRLPVDELVLLDTDPDRLDVVGGLAHGCWIDSTGPDGSA